MGVLAILGLLFKIAFAFVLFWCIFALVVFVFTAIVGILKWFWDDLP